jgi:2-amino-4-hydroxy-6-hydroxymethyldihydropteridine diphosphokinase
MSMVYLSIGSNIDREASVRKCLSKLSEQFGGLQCSNVYESAPVGFDGPAFWNLVVAFDCEMTLETLRGKLHDIEQVCGRERKACSMSRTMDIDLLLYGDVVAKSIPRDEIERYAFVLRPLAELAPEVRHPLSGISMRTLWARFDASSEQLYQVQVEFACA